MATKKQIGGRIRDLRRTRGYSQERLAEIVGINAKYLSSIERGEENPTLDLFIRLAAGLRVEIHEMFQIEQEPKALRQRLRALATEARDEDLTRAIRILEALVHG